MKFSAIQNTGFEAGEIFSLGATSEESEKIGQVPADLLFSGAPSDGDVTLTSESVSLCHTAEKTLSPELAFDLNHLTNMQLRAKYRAEANSHRNMLNRCSCKGAKIHLAFRRFRSFLRHVGAMPASGATLDRIDNTDPQYGPGKVRWADRHTQNNNKGDTLTFYDSTTGQTFTASRLAKLQNVDPSTIRQRRRRGWSDVEVIAGKKGSFDPAKPYAVKKDTFHSSNAIPTRKPHSKGIPASKSAAQIAFEREAELFAYCRERFDEEPLPAPYYELNEELAGVPGVRPITAEEEKLRFIKLWPQYRPHLIFENADPHHQRLIEEIDPEYVKQQREKATSKAEATGFL